MTKVECPGPGFKGLKWKWIQDHAKEQQEREKGRMGAPPAQQAAPDQSQQLQRLEGGSGVRPPSNPDVCAGSHAGLASACNPGLSPAQRQDDPKRQHDGVSAASQQRSVHPEHPNYVVKVESGIGPPGPGPGLAALVQATCMQPEDRMRANEQGPQAYVRAPTLPAAQRATTPEAPSTGEPHTSTAQQAAVLPSSRASSPSQAALNAASGLPDAGSGTIAAAAPPLPHPAIGIARRISVEVASATLPSSVLSLPIPVPVTSGLPLVAASGVAHIPPLPPASFSVPIACAATSAPVILPTALFGMPSASAPALGVGVPHSSIITSPAAPSPTVSASAAAVGALQPLLAAAGPSGPPHTGGARVRLPPARAPSLTVTAINTGKVRDDFESMFTPLSSIPTVKSETPQPGGATASRAGSLLPGLQAAACNAGGAAGSGDGGSGAGAGAAEVGPVAGERKAPLRKASRLTDLRPSAEPPEGHVPAPRSRTPTAQVSPGTLATRDKEKDKEGSVGTANANGLSKAQGSQQLGPGQGALQPQQSLLQQQRPSAGKPAGRDAKDGVRVREPSVGLTTLPSGGGSGALQPARVGTGDKTSGQAPVSGGPDATERKRPRSEGSKLKSGPSAAELAGQVDLSVLCSETLADRVKRTKRTTTSSSEQEGPHSLGYSAERPTGNTPPRGNAAGAEGSANAAAGGEGGVARPATSAEAQSRGAEAPTGGGGGGGGGSSQGGGAGPVMQGAGTQAADDIRGASGAGVGGSSSLTVKQKQRGGQVPQSRGKVSGRAEEPSPPLATSSRRGGADRQLEQQEHARAGGGTGMRVSGGGAVTDSSGGGAGPTPPPRGSLPPGVAKPGTSGGPLGVKRAADLPASRRLGAPPFKLPRADPQLPRPHPAQGQERKSGGGGAGQAGTPAPLPPAAKQAHRTSDKKADGGASGPQDNQALASGYAVGMGHGHGPSPTAPTSRPGRQGEAETPAAVSCRGAVAGSRGSKDGAGGKGAYGPRGGGGEAVCGDGAATAAGTTTTDPKTDSDTRTSRIVECYFEFEQSCRGGGGSASLSGLGSGGSMAAARGHAHFAGGGGGGRFMGGGFTRSGGPPLPPQNLDLGKIRSFKELWTHLAALYEGTLPDEMDSKIIYLDEEGDWIMVTPDEPWSSVAAAATKVLVTNRT